MERLERWARPFHGFGEWLANAVSAVYRTLGGPGKLLQDFLNGAWLGHTLHGVLTDATVGAVTALLLLDAVAVAFGVHDLETASVILLGFCALAAWGAVAAGLTDYKDTASGNERNVGTLHGLINIAGTVFYTVAFFVRWGGGIAAGRWLALIGFILLSTGAFVGGHLVFKYGYMVNHNAFARGKRARDFTPVMAAADLAEATPTKASLGATGLVIVKRGDLVFALKETCSHAGGPLAEGTLDGDRIICPWHGSTFWLADGRVHHGPAGTRQVAYQARITEGQVEVQGPIS